MGLELDLTIHGMMAQILLRAYGTEHTAVWADPRNEFEVYPVLLSIELVRARNPGDEEVKVGAGSG
jgi:hypothetical protein